MKKVMAILLAAGALLAAEMQVGEFKQHIELGYLGTSGNSDSQTLSALYSNEYQWLETTDLHFRADAYYGEKDGDKTDERYRAHALANHMLNDRWYAYAEAGALRNPFEGFEQQYNGGIGIGYIVLDNATQLLKVRGGYQYRYANLTTGDDEDYHFLKLGANHEYHFNEKTDIVSELNFLEDRSPKSSTTLPATRPAPSSFSWALPPPEKPCSHASSPKIWKGMGTTAFST